MSCPTCKNVLCDCDSSLEGLYSGFSLVGGDVGSSTVLPNEESGYVMHCPPGVTCIIRVPCASGEIVRLLPKDSSDASIQTAVNEMIALCESTPRSDNVVQIVANQPVTISCEGGLLINLVGSISQSGITFDSATKKLTVAGGIFSTVKASSETVASALSRANGEAQTWGEATRDALITSGDIECGYWNSEQTVTCGDGTTRTASAFTQFSTTSQAAADALAVAAAQADCPTACIPAMESLTWVVSGGIDGGGSGPSAYANHTGVGNTQVTSSQFSSAPGVNCSLHVEFTSLGGAIGRVYLATGGGDLFNSAVSFSGDIPVFVTSSLLQQIIISAGGSASGGSSIAITMGPP